MREKASSDITKTLSISSFKLPGWSISLSTLNVDYPSPYSVQLTTVTFSTYAYTTHKRNSSTYVKLQRSLNPVSEFKLLPLLFSLVKLDQLVSNAVWTSRDLRRISSTTPVR